MRNYIARRLPQAWYQRKLSLKLLPLLPLSWLFGVIAKIRRTLYQKGILPSHTLPVPVIIIGNITTGGSGKTPFVIWLVKQLQEQGWRPGIISRGYGGLNKHAVSVTASSRSEEVGDEPLLLARRCHVPVFICKDRVNAGQALLSAHPECTVIIADDGLQHYRLQRSVEIIVFDERGIGNAQLLPAGPLREPVERLQTVTAIVHNLSAKKETQLDIPVKIPAFTMRLKGEAFTSLASPHVLCERTDFQGKRLYAIAGIGHPERFFSQLEEMGIRFTARPFPDHHCYSHRDLDTLQDGTLLMTEKDAVKCQSLTLGEAWVLPVSAHVYPSLDGKELIDIILENLNGPSSL